MAKNTTPKQRPSVKQAKKSIASQPKPASSGTSAPRAQKPPVTYRSQGQSSYESRARERYGGKKPKQRRRLGWPQLLFLLIFFTALAAGVLFSWNQWFRYDDAKDIQGQWTSSDTGSAVVIEGSKLKLVDELAYDYTLDTGEKKIFYSFSNLSGGGYYLFSTDRQKLVIFEGEHPGWMHVVKVALGQAEPEEGAPSDTTTVLTRQAEPPIITPAEEGGEESQQELPDQEDGNLPSGEEGAPNAE